MRLPHLACATALALVWSAAPALAQFQVRAQDAPPPVTATPPAGGDQGLGPAPSPAPASPLGGAPRANTGSLNARPAPFDVNNDGRTPNVELPDDTPAMAVQPSSTVSPLAPGQMAATMPVDATGAEQRDELVRMLHENTTQIRELRVAVDSADEYTDALVDRPIMPDRTLRLEGELDSRAWSVYLTAAEAARGGTLSLAFNNSVLVLPEGSRMRLFLNGREVVETAIDSPDRTKVITLPVSADLLRPGENQFRIEAEMRHRIDCSVNATYELWTRIDTRLTGLSAQGINTAVTGLPDLPAVGVGTNGATRLRVIMDQPSNPPQIDRMLRLVQAAALRGRFGQPLVEVVGTDAELDSAVGTLNIAVGPAGNLSRMIPDLPTAASRSATVGLANTDFGPTVVISGPTERDVETALAQFVDIETAGTGQNPSNGPLIDGATTISLADVGLDTIDFSGRRFRTGFNVTLPPDFYAAAYGEAELLLDAAYSASIDPNSELVIYVNGVSSTSVAFASADRRVFRDFPVQLGMQAFKPGVNRIEMVAELRTDDDTACLPGATAPSGERFALLNSTQLIFPQFARIGQLPNLASFVADGFPYELGDNSVSLMVAGQALDSIGAAGTLMSRIAVGRGSALQTTYVERPEAYLDQGLIVVGPVAEVPSSVLSATNASRIIPSTWESPAAITGRGEEPQGLEQYDEVLRRLRQQLRQEDAQLDRAATVLGESRRDSAGSDTSWFDTTSETSIINNVLRPIREAFNFNFDLFTEGDDNLSPGAIPDAASLVLIQNEAPNNEKTAWTLVTAPTPSILSTSMAALTAPGVWDQISGRASAFTLESNSVDSIRATRVSYVATLPLSFGNMRLIAANWFSINNGVYAIALVVAAFLLGFITWVLVRPLGRRN